MTFLGLYIYYSALAHPLVFAWLFFNMFVPAVHLINPESDHETE